MATLTMATLVIATLPIAALTVATLTMAIPTAAVLALPHQTQRAHAVLTAWAEAMASEGNTNAPDDQARDTPNPSP